MSNSEQKPKARISTIWTDAVLEGEPARVSIVNGTARIRIGWFDIHVPGKFDSDVDEVIAAYERQVEETEKAFRKLPDDWEQSSCCDDLLAITDEELEREIREFEKHRGQVINIKTRQSI
jgi:hypothetical protein